VSPSGPPDFDLTPYAPTLWLRAADMAGFADGDAVGGGDPDDWENLGSVASDFTQGTANLRPTFQENEVNTTLPAVRFSASPSGEEDRLVSTGTNMSSYITSSAYLIYLVVRPSIGGGTDGSSRYYRRPRIFGTSTDSLHIGLYDTKFALNHNSVTGPKILTPTAFTVNTWNLVEAYYDGTTMSIRFNNGSAGTIAGATTGALGAVAQIGAGTDAKFDGDVAEVVAFSTALSSGDRTAIMQGLGDMYGITV
jgi:hypothetical protein